MKRIPLGEWPARLAVVTVAASAAHALPAIAGIPPVTRRIHCGQPPATGKREIRMTFDDGPHPGGTPAVLDVLGENGATATFFVIGEQAARYPGLCRRIVADGHEIAVHGWDHRLLLRLRPAATVRRIRRATTLIADVTGTMPRRFRPPYGVASAAALIACGRLGLAPTWWTAWGWDWARGASAASVQSHVLRGLGQVRAPTVLLHDSDSYGTPGSWRITAAALEPLVRRWARAGIPVRSLERAGQPPTAG